LIGGGNGIAKRYKATVAAYWRAARQC
jgi:hypothetical protein